MYIHKNIILFLVTIHIDKREGFTSQVPVIVFWPISHNFIDTELKFCIFPNFHFPK